MTRYEDLMNTLHRGQEDGAPPRLEGASASETEKQCWELVRRIAANLTRKEAEP